MQREDHDVVVGEALLEEPVDDFAHQARLVGRISSRS